MTGFPRPYFKPNKRSDQTRPRGRESWGGGPVNSGLDLLILPPPPPFFPRASQAEKEVKSPSSSPSSAAAAAASAALALSFFLRQLSPRGAKGK